MGVEIRYFVKETIEQWARKPLVVHEHAIQIMSLDNENLWFQRSIMINDNIVDIVEQIEHLWIATYWDEEQQRGVQFMISSSSLFFSETGEIYAVETWWPLFKKP